MQGQKCSAQRERIVVIITAAAASSAHAPGGNEQIGASLGLMVSKQVFGSILTRVKLTSNNQKTDTRVTRLAVVVEK
jgi:hypothetical protein